MDQVNVIHLGDALTVLRQLPDGFVNCVVTSPPYFGLRDYGEEGQIGLEDSPQAYVEALVAVFREVRRVLRDDGVCWLNLGDSYANDAKWGGKTGGKHAEGLHGANGLGRQKRHTGLKSKDLIGIPWRVAFALQDDGWYLRSAAPWIKGNAMPESVLDRATTAHEYVFQLAKCERYWFDSYAVHKPAGDWGTRDRSNFRGGTQDPKLKHHGFKGVPKQDQVGKRTYTGFNDRYFAGPAPLTRNRRTSDTFTEMMDEQIAHWQYVRAHGGVVVEGDTIAAFLVNPSPYKNAHFATFPPALITPMILSGCPRQVCTVCGAPYIHPKRRKVKAVREAQPQDHLPAHGQRASGKRGNRVANVGRFKTSVSFGEWIPACQCEADTRPGVTLDPFMGSGTTAYVAKQYGRHYVGIELSAEYIALAEKRLEALMTGPERLSLKEKQAPAQYESLPLFAVAEE